MTKRLKALVVCKHPENSKEAKVCKPIAKNGIKVKYSWKNNLERSDLEGFDLVISIGGDGTALSASHYLLYRPLLAVNSSPRRSEGALTTVDIKDLDKKLRQIKRGKYKTEKLERIEVSIDGKEQVPLALNEVFIANEKAYLMSKYKVRFRSKKKRVEEEQRSSGVIFSTGTGSTAWFKSAGGKPFSPQSKFIRMIVREPFIRRLRKFSLVESVIKEKDSIEVILMTNAVLVIDSIREFKLKEGSKIKIRISKWPLLRII